MRRSVLVVDDNRATLLGLTELLTLSGYRVRTAGSFAAGREALAAEHPDVLLVDIRLGEFNGLQLVATSPQSAAVVMTGHDDVDLERKARRMGADYLVKPVPPAVLLETIERHVTARSCDS